MVTKVRKAKIKTHKFSQHKYNSLRSEMVSRICNIINQAHTAIFTIITTWAAGITILSYTLKKGIAEIKNVELMCIIGAFIF